MPPRDLDEIRRLEQRAYELRRGRPVDPDTARFNERVAEGLQLTGDVIRWMRTGERPGADVAVARRARIGWFVEQAELGSVVDSSWDRCRATAPSCAVHLKHKGEDPVHKQPETSNQFDRALAHLDLEPIKVKLMDRGEGPGWSLQKCDQVELAYKRFLILHSKYPERNVVPTPDIDAFWHHHILDTAKYADDCSQLFGRFLHHYPYFGIGGDEDASALLAAFQETCHLYFAEFGDEYAQTREAPGASACRSGGSSCKSSGPASRPIPARPVPAP